MERPRIDLQIAKRQILRLAVLSGFRTGDTEADVAARKELVQALQEKARDSQHAGRIISRWIEESRFAPTPYDLGEIARQTDHEYQPEHWICAACQGTGWRETYQHIVWTDSDNKTIAEISREQYEQLRPQVSGVAKQDVVQRAMKRCNRCSVGRRRIAAAEEERNA